MILKYTFLALVLISQTGAFASSNSVIILNNHNQDESLALECADQNCDILDVEYRTGDALKSARFNAKGMQHKSSLVVEYTAEAKPQNRPDWVHAFALMLPEIRHDEEKRSENIILDCINHPGKTFRLDGNKFTNVRMHLLESRRSIKN